MEVRSLNSPEELQRYVNFSQEVYRDNSQWVPPDSHHLVELLSGQGGFGPESHIQPFWVEDADRVLATITAVINDTYNRRWNARLGHLVFFEALPDQNEAVEMLMRAANGWLSARDCESVRMSLLPAAQGAVPQARRKSSGAAPGVRCRKPNSFTRWLAGAAAPPITRSRTGMKTTFAWSTKLSSSCLTFSR